MIMSMIGMDLKGSSEALPRKLRAKSGAIFLAM